MNPPDNRPLGLLTTWGRMGSIFCCVLLVSFALTRLMSRLGDAALLTMNRQQKSMLTPTAGTACGSCHRSALFSSGTTEY